MVCITLATPSTGCSSQRLRVSSTPAGMLTSVPISSANKRQLQVRGQIAGQQGELFAHGGPAPSSESTTLGLAHRRLDQLPHVVIGGRVQQFARRADLDQAPSRMTPMRSPSSSASAMSCVTKIAVSASCRRIFEEGLLQAVAGQRVQRAERLVEQHDARRRGQRPGHADALLLSAGQLRRAAVSRYAGRAVPPVPAVRRPARAMRAGIPAVQGQRDGDVLADAHVREQADALEHVADAPPQDVRRDVAGILASRSAPGRWWARSAG